MEIAKWAYMLIMVAAFAGCAASMLDLTEQGIVSLEVRDPAKVRISHINVHRDEGGMVISGRVERRSRMLPVGFVGHMDVTVLDLGGTVLARKGVYYYPRRVPIRRAGYSTFKVVLPIAPVPGTVLRVEHHKTMGIVPDEHAIF